MLTLVRVTQTSVACLSQWDAEGNYYYLRYRHGHGSVRQYADAASDEVITIAARFEHGPPLDGVISLEEFAEHAGIAIAEGAMITGLDDCWRDELIPGGAISPSALEEEGGTP